MREGCPNYEVMVFQPRTFPTPYLGSVSYCYYLIYPFRPTFFFSRFLDHYFPSLSYLLPICSCYSLKPSKFPPAPFLLSRCEAPSTWTPTAPSVCQPLLLVPAPHAACLRLLPFPFWFAPPFSDLGLHPGTCRPLVGFSLHRYLRVSVSLTLPTRVLLQILASSGFCFLVGWLFAKRLEAKAPPLPGSRAPWSSPPNTWPCRRRSAPPPPHPPTHPLPITPLLL